MNNVEEKYKESKNSDGMGCLFICIALFTWFFCIPSFVWWLFWWDHTNPWGDKIIAYPLICSKDYKGDRCTGEEKVGRPIRYRISKDRAEVFVLTITGIPPKKLIKCDIFDNENWECSLPDGSGKVFFVEGLQISNDPKVKYISQFRYRLF